VTLIGKQSADEVSQHISLPAERVAVTNIWHQLV